MVIHNGLKRYFRLSLEKNVYQTQFIRFKTQPETIQNQPARVKTQHKTQ